MYAIHQASPNATNRERERVQEFYIPRLKSQKKEVHFHVQSLHDEQAENANEHYGSTSVWIFFPPAISLCPSP